jgi:DNA repair protein RadC
MSLLEHGTKALVGRRAAHERPRERMLVHGGEALADVELVALVLGGGRSLERATAVLDHIGGLSGLATACSHEIGRAPGIGQASAAALCAVVELGRRIAGRELPYAAALRSPDDVVGYARSVIGMATQEVFMVLGLDARQRVRIVRRVGMGSLAQVDVHPREVFRPLVRAGMHSVILVHNHPSGDADPSDADLTLTQRLAEAGRLLGIPVLDHLVVAGADSVSLAKLGLMPAP